MRYCTCHPLFNFLSYVYYFPLRWEATIVGDLLVGVNLEKIQCSSAIGEVKKDVLLLAQDELHVQND